MCLCQNWTDNESFYIINSEDSISMCDLFNLIVKNKHNNWCVGGR